MNQYIPVNRPLFSGNELKYVSECIKTGWVSSEGPFVEAFERKMAEEVDRKYGVAVCNGSVALDLAVIALDIRNGDEVIMPTFTIISCAAAIVRVGAVPVLIDSDPITFNMNVKDVEAKITKKTKGIMVVHIYGFPVDMDPVLSLAKKYNLKVIEDTAEMHGQTYKGKKCGSFGDISTFSFYPNKNITTGEGGMLLMDEEDIYLRCKSYRNLCFKSGRRFVHDELGFNYRMSNIQAALGVAQLEKLDSHLEKRKWIAAQYDALLKDLTSVTIPKQKIEFAGNAYWVYSIVINDDRKMDAEEAMALLNKEGVGTRPFFWPMHQQPVFNNRGMYIHESYPVAERIALKGFYIPCGLGITAEEIIIVADRLRKIFK